MVAILKITVLLYFLFKKVLLNLAAPFSLKIFSKMGK
jgi:hypothetical protein